MSNTSVRLHDLADWVREESDRRSVAKAQIIRDAVRAAAEGDGPYADHTADSDVHERLDRLEQRLDRLEASRSESVGEPVASRNRAGGGSGPSTSESEPSRSEEMAGQILGLGDDATQYSLTDTRVEAISAAVARLAQQGEATTAELVAVADEYDHGISHTQRMLSDVAGALPAVETPPRGSNRYQWVAE